MANFTIPTNVTNMVDLFSQTNTMVDGLLGLALLFSIFFISFIASKYYRTEQAFTVSCFITSIAGYLLVIMGLVESYYLIVPTLALAYSLFFHN